VDLFEPGTGLTVQLHDFNGGIAPSGLFWTVPIPDHAFEVKGKRARLRLGELPVVDSYVIFGPTEDDALVSMDLVWEASEKKRHIRPGSSDPTDPTAFAGEFRNAVATGSFSGVNLGSGFRFHAEGATSEGIFAEIGHERNGFFLKHAPALASGGEPAIEEAPAIAPAPTAARALPSPATTATRIEFSVSATAPGTVAVFDLAGRRVATLMAGETLTPGRHGADWNLRDAEGRRVVPGVYLVRWQAGAEGGTSRVVVLPN